VDSAAITKRTRLEFEVAIVAHHPQVGEDLLIPTGVVHSARNIGKITARWLWGCKGA
jgi:hypothetical protein